MSQRLALAKDENAAMNEQEKLERVEIEQAELVLDIF